MGRSLKLSPQRVFDGGPSACVCLCAHIPPCAGAGTPRSQVAYRTRRAARECPPFVVQRVGFLFCAEINFVAGNEVVECTERRGVGSVTMLPPRMFDGGTGVCVCLCACMSACAGTVTPRSAVAHTTRRAASEFPPPSPAPHRREECRRTVLRRDECRRAHCGLAGAAVSGSVFHAVAATRV